MGTHNTRAQPFLSCRIGADLVPCWRRWGEPAPALRRSGLPNRPASVQEWPLPIERAVAPRPGHRTRRGLCSDTSPAISQRLWRAYNCTLLGCTPSGDSAERGPPVSVFRGAGDREEQREGLPRRITVHEEGDMHAHVCLENTENKGAVMAPWCPRGRRLVGGVTLCGVASNP